MHKHVWKSIGIAIGKSTSLLTFTCTACNLNIDNNLKMLLDGASHNNSLEKIDLSDNELDDDHGAYILIYLQKQVEKRDFELWWLSLRQ